MIDYSQREDDICVLLENDIYTVKPLPENEADYPKNLNKSCALIMCCGADFSEPENLSVMVQEETISFDVTILAKTRRGESGIFAIIKNISDKIMGYQFPGCGKIQLKSHGYKEGGPNEWNYIFSFSMTSKTMENQPEEPFYPLKNPEFVNG